MILRTMLVISVERKNPPRRGQIGEESRSAEEQTSDLKNEQMKTTVKCLDIRTFWRI